MSHDCAEDVGILAMELYFPRTAIRQPDLANADGQPVEKYTVGLGQSEMAFCGDREDVSSVCLTVTRNLFKAYGVSPGSIGFLEVGTETLTDKSKSIKTTLMQLWDQPEDPNDLNHWSVEGLQTVNACFGGTQALFHAVNWLESSSWDGRLALVVMGDIATYGEPRARPTGGAGAMAVLLGPSAPLVLEPRLRALHSRHSWDFYKPRMDSEYPVVDGAHTVQTYTAAIDACYSLYKQKAGGDVSLASFDGICFHCPYSKLVQKSLARLAFIDFRDSGREVPPEVGESARKVLEEMRTTPLSDCYGHSALDKASMELSKAAFTAQTLPSLAFAKRLGNCYTPSLYAGLASWLTSRPESELLGQRILLFSFGSGFASAMFSLRISSAKDSGLGAMRLRLLGARARLDERSYQSPALFEAARGAREQLLGKAPHHPTSPVDAAHFFQESYYLDNIDEQYRRTYCVFQG